jgi:hypothetical protein
LQYRITETVSVSLKRSNVIGHALFIGLVILPNIAILVAFSICVAVGIIGIGLKKIGVYDYYLYCSLFVYYYYLDIVKYSQQVKFVDFFAYY